MNVKKWSPVLTMLFTYLAISKIYYWVNTILALTQDDLSSVFVGVLSRLLSQDLPIILSVVAFFYLERFIGKVSSAKKSKFSIIIDNLMLIVLGYAGLAAIVFVYNIALSLVLDPQSFTMGVFVSEFIDFLPSLTVAYFAVIVVLETKSHLKSKEKEGSSELAVGRSLEDKRLMLQALLDDGLLTQEEFDRKKDLLE